MYQIFNLFDFSMNKTIILFYIHHTRIKHLKLYQENITIIYVMNIKIYNYNTKIYYSVFKIISA